MLQKLKMTTYAFILCLFGLTFMTVSPVLAGEKSWKEDCQAIPKSAMKEKKNCFRDIATDMRDRAYRLESAICYTTTVLRSHLFPFPALASAYERLAEGLNIESQYPHYQMILDWCKKIRIENINSRRGQ